MKLEPSEIFKVLGVETRVKIIELLKSHRSIRKFSTDPVPQKIVEELIQAGQCAATSSFIQACTVIQVTEPAIREKLCEAAAGQLYVKDSPVFLVFCADMQRHRSIVVQIDLGRF